MDVPTHVVRWVDTHFSRPKVDPEWLAQCYEWLVSEGHDPRTKFKALTDAISHQILESNLADSMLPGTGLPPQVASLDTTLKLTGAPILVEIVSLTEVANSAFNLNQTRVAIEERLKEGNIEEGEGEGDLEIEGEGPMPKYPRGMLKFHLSDGSITVPAMEYRSLPELSIESTPLGFKLLLKNTQIRRGVAFLEPDAVSLIGHYTEDRDAHRQKDFARGLRARMGLPEPVEEEEREDQIMQEEPPEVQQIRSPLRDISPPPSPTLAQRTNDEDDDLDGRKRRIPNQGPQTQTPASTSTTLVPTAASRYFSSGSSEVSFDTGPATSSSLGIDLDPPPPRRNEPLFLPSPAPSPPTDEHFWSDDVEMLDADHQRKSNKPAAAAAAAPPPPAQKPKEANNPPIRLLGKLKQQAEKQAAGPSSSKGKAPVRTSTMTGYSSDDYGEMSFVVDDDLLNEMEKQGYAASQSQSRSQSQTAPDKMPPPAPPSTQAPSKRPAPAPFPLAAAPTMAGGLSSQPTVVDLTRMASLEIITIDDEEEAVDKENVPVPSRNVRRRTEEATSISSGPPRASQRVPGQPRILAKTESAVIDLSDSD